MTENDVYEALELIAAREPVPLSLLGRRGLALPGLACRERGWVQQPDRDGPLFTTQEGRKALAAFDACRAHAKRIEEGLHPIGEISAPQSVRDDLRKRVLDPGEEYNEEAPTSNLVSEVRARLDDAVNAAVSMIQGYTETTQEFAKLREGLEVQAVDESIDEGRDIKQVQAERVAELEDTSAFEKHLDELRAGLKTEAEFRASMENQELRHETKRVIDDQAQRIRGYKQQTQEKCKIIDDLTAQLSARCQQNTGPKLGENPPSENHELISYIYNHHHRSFRGTRKAAQLGELAYRGHWSDNPNSHSSRSGRMVHLAETTYGAISMWCRDGTRSFEVYLAPVCNPTPQLNDVQLSQLAADCAAAVVVPPEETKP